MKPVLQSFDRKELDENPLHGVVVAESKSLLLIHRVYDFLFDGFQVIRRRDVTDAYSQESHYADLIRKEGLWKNPPKSVRALPIDNWQELFSALEGKTVVVEGEQIGEFCIGPVVGCTSRAVSIHYFNPHGEWEDVRRINLRNVTTMRFDDRYSSIYARHLPPRPEIRKSRNRNENHG